MSIWWNRNPKGAFEDEMLNIFVTYRCNLACPYCFARELFSDFPHDMRREDFNRLLQWMTDTGVTRAALIGGEPTLHPEILTVAMEMCDAGIDVVLFTNGLFAGELAARLPLYISHFVINYNDPERYAPGQYERLHDNLSQLVAADSTITFSKNFSPNARQYEHFLNGVKHYGIRAVRYDITRPGHSGTNEFTHTTDSRELMAHIVRFVRECEALGVKTGMDCCVRYCDLSHDDRAFLERVSMKFRGICHPSIDIHPDLSASYCLPLKDVAVRDVTAFASRDRLMHHFAATVRPWRFENVSENCLSCHDFKKKCQGGCMVTKMKERDAAGMDSAGPKNDRNLT